ncbi:transcriptional regulator [Anabaena sp. CCY 9402-a]|uniref:transcriptional regulator n=1 Tax=Anabaena sp. CCY 9402-a TaxID=3103867 RepID=UPI0039C6F20C
MKTKPYGELRKRMTPERRAESAARAKMMLLHINLMELKESLALTKNELENDLNVLESAISELETQEDIQLSTLSRCVKALGGKLKIVAHFSDEEITLTEFD